MGTYESGTVNSMGVCSAALLASFDGNLPAEVPPPLVAGGSSHEEVLGSRILEAFASGADGAIVKEAAEAMMMRSPKRM